MQKKNSFFQSWTILRQAPNEPMIIVPLELLSRISPQMLDMLKSDDDASRFMAKAVISKLFNYNFDTLEYEHKNTDT